MLSFNTQEARAQRNRLILAMAILSVFGIVVLGGLAYAGYYLYGELTGSNGTSQLASQQNDAGKSGNSPSSTASSNASNSSAKPKNSTKMPGSHQSSPLSPNTNDNKSTSSTTGGTSSQPSSGGGANPPASNPPQTATKPTDATTGPRIATTTMSGGALSGSYSGKHFTSMVTANGPLDLTDCIIDGGMRITDGPVVVDHCIINGWFGVTTDNTNPNKQIATVKFTKINGPTGGDTMRIGPYHSGWGNNNVYVNTLFEDSIIHAQFNYFGHGSHFDVLQFGGGRNSTFDRVVMSYDNYPYHSENTNTVNNGTKNINVVFNHLWVEGGPMGYVLSGPMTVNDCVIDRSSAHYGYTYPKSGVVLNNCVDDTGARITAT